MTVDQRARSPLAHRLDDLAAVGLRTGGGMIVEHVPFLAQVDVRLDAALVGRAPYPLPTTPNTAWEDGPRAVLWLGPDEWLVLGPPGAASEIVARVGGRPRRDRTGRSSTCRRTAWRSSSPARARWRSSRKDVRSTCTRDRGGAGMCAQTMLARAQVILHERSETTGILVRPSFADYLVDWLIDASGA